MEQSTNSAVLRGSLEALPQFSHESHGKRFSRFILAVPRLSGTVDRLPVVAEQAVLDAIDPSGGEMLTVTGQVRSHNLRLEDTRRLMIFLFAQHIAAEDGPPINQVALEGLLCKEPVYRQTPLGREICDVMLAVPRTFHRADYLPCILRGSTAREIASCHVRDRVRMDGRLQSRIYTKYIDDVPQERVAYEVSALTAQPLPDPA